MDVDGFLQEVTSSRRYRGQIVYVHEAPPRAAQYAEKEPALSEATRALLAGMGVERLYIHQAEAICAAKAGRDVLLTTGTASGKSLSYIVPVVEMLQAEERGTALLLFPTKALCQDQFRTFRAGLDLADLREVLAGVYDGDTPAATRRKLRAHGRVIFSNPDMLHASILPQHPRWAEFLGHLRFLVLDELHVYNGIFGANMANLLRRLDRLSNHYGSHPIVIACSATIGNPRELAARLLGREVVLVDRDGSPRGRRVYLLWNPPRIRKTIWHSRRSANVEAHELMAQLIRRSVPTITFSKAKMTAEMIYRYVCEKLRRTAPHLAAKVTPYRGGYRPEERREIERRLFSGDLLGVSTTPALELGIDVGAMEASIIVGYPGTVASFFQQSGRAGRGERDSLAVLIGLDTAVNQYIMTHPEYLFARPIEQVLVDSDNPFVILNHLRAAAHEKPLTSEEICRFGPYAELALRVLEQNRKLHRVGANWYHATKETPQHEFSLRAMVDANVIIEDADTGETLGEIDRLDAPAIVHPEAIYMHRGDTYRVLMLDLEKNIARVKRVEVDYYTQPIGGADVHHIDACLREKQFGTGRACWGEVTAYFRTWGYEKIRFYELDPISFHPLNLPTFQLDTMAVWIVPPEDLMLQVRNAGLDVHAGLRGIGYGTRMLLPLFVTCDTLSFSHSVGSVNSEWNAIFIYERYPHGLGYTHRAYEQLHLILPAVLDNIRRCPCEDGCPNCTGKPLRQFASWNVELHEANIPSKAAARMILEGLLGDGTRLDCPDFHTLSDEREAEMLRLENALRRRLERMREPQLFHPIQPHVETGYPEAEMRETLDLPDVTRRVERKKEFKNELRKKLAKKLRLGGLPPHTPVPGPPPGMKGHGTLTPQAFPGRPTPDALESSSISPSASERAPIRLGDSLAAKARRLLKNESQRRHEK